MTTDSVFSRLSKINVNDHVEKKGAYNYLSWTFAVQELRNACPDARWDVVKTNGAPYIKTDAGCFVEVSVTVDGLTLSQIHPVLDQKNRPIENPDAFQINTSIQRCLVKAIALHGLGLYIYAGEDLPEIDIDESIAATNNVQELNRLFKSLNEKKQAEFMPKFASRKKELVPKEIPQEAA